MATLDFKGRNTYRSIHSGDRRCARAFEPTAPRLETLQKLLHVHESQIELKSCSLSPDQALKNGDDREAGNERHGEGSPPMHTVTPTRRQSPRGDSEHIDKKSGELRRG
jgi:hypothetical protein